MRRSRSFKVIDVVGTNRKPVCDFLLVIYTNCHPISFRFEVIADYFQILDTVFLSPYGGLSGPATYTVHLRLIGIGKLVVDFVFVSTR